jgi:type I restriction enzyme S subunit
MFGGDAIATNRWEQVPVSNVIEKPLSGEWGKDDPEKTGLPVLRTTNFTDIGELNFEEVITRQIDEKKATQKFLRFGDTIIEKSGGSDTKPVGRVVYFKGADESYLFNNFTALLRPKTNMNSRYVFTALFVDYRNGGTKLFENKTTGIHNLKLAEYLANMLIPLPPLDLQNRFAEFAAAADKSKFVAWQAARTAAEFGIMLQNILFVATENKKKQCKHEEQHDV